ncbi:MAG: XamI family restriction endonuclease [Acidobacteria bacterium]|nr:XamI family restriction endonuclease [Acidobacteriota bacterium]
MQEHRDPNDAGRETASAALASAAMAAMRRSETARRSESKTAQELFVEDALSQRQFVQVGTHPVRTLAEAPEPGQFCRESMLGTRKADFIIGLPDRRVMPLECKVSNSYTNSIKRLNNDAAVKAEVWRRDFGDMNVIPAAVLSGAFKLHNLEDAQRRGLTLFWSHSLEAQLLDWIERTRT